MKFYTFNPVKDNEIPVRARICPCTTIDFKEIFIDSDSPLKTLKEKVGEYALLEESRPFYLKNLFTANVHTTWLQYAAPFHSFVSGFNLDWIIHKFMLFLLELKELNIKPRLCLIDVYNPFLSYRLGIDKIIELYKNDLIMSSLANEVKLLDVASFKEDHPDFAASIDKWNRYFNWKVNKMIEAAMDKAYLLVWNKKLPWSNMGDVTYKYGTFIQGQWGGKEFASRAGNLNTPDLSMHIDRPKFAKSINPIQLCLTHIIDYYRLVKKPKVPIISKPGIFIEDRLTQNEHAINYWKFLVEQLEELGCEEVIYDNR